MADTQKQADKVLTTAEDFIEGRAEAAVTQEKLAKDFADLLQGGDISAVLDKMSNRGTLPDGLPSVIVSEGKNERGLPNSIQFKPSFLERGAQAERAIEINLPESKYSKPWIRLKTTNDKGYDDPAFHKRIDKERSDQQELELRSRDPRLPAPKDVLFSSGIMTAMKEFEHHKKDSLGNVESLTISGYNTTSKLAFENLDKWTSLKKLDLSGVSVDASHLAFIAKATTLESLNLNGSHITDNDLKMLKSLPKMKELSLDTISLKDSASLTLKEMKGLESLSLFARAGDQTVKNLSELPNLRKLDLNNSNITAASMHYLKEMTNLKELNIYGGELTLKQKEQIEQNMPWCKVRY